MSIEQRLKELNLELPAVTPPVATYVNAARTGNLMFLSGKVPVEAGGKFLTGKVGKDVSTEEAAKHARLVGLHLIAVMRHELGSLDKVKRVVKLLGMVNAVPEYGEQPKVINGCSDLMVEVFGDKGRHARSAIGVGSLPAGVTVEIEAIVEVE
jgi:enamine deaminase RidA (YjgF/YER057c/UK114 family)